MSDTRELTVTEALTGQRLDRALAELVPDHSRSRLQRWIRAGRVTLDGRPARPREIVSTGQQIRVTPEDMPAGEDSPGPEPIPLDVVHEDAALLIVAKPPSLVVHPGAGNPDGTLLNALLHHAPELARVPRGGIVHRLDKDTSGLMVVARTPEAHTRLVEMIQERRVDRSYLAVAAGRMISGGTVDRPLGRDPADRRRMAVREGGRPAVTHLRVAERYRRHTLVRARLATGRTHQIRVHLRAVGHPLVGDPVYGGRPRPPPGASPALSEKLQHFGRQALHAADLALPHPQTGEQLSWHSPLPEDMASLVEALREDARQSDDG